MKTQAYRLNAVAPQEPSKEPVSCSPTGMLIIDMVCNLDPVCLTIIQTTAFPLTGI